MKITVSNIIESKNTYFPSAQSGYEPYECFIEKNYAVYGTTVRNKRKVCIRFRDVFTNNEEKTPLDSIKSGNVISFTHYGVDQQNILDGEINSVKLITSTSSKIAEEATA